MYRNRLDEMQEQNKNKIGNQTFFLLFYLLLLDAGLYGFGFRWINYPANIILILTLCGGIYLIRLIYKNAYVGPSMGKEKTVFKVLLAIILSVVCFLWLQGKGLEMNNALIDNTAIILFIASTILLIITMVVGLIRWKQNKNDRDE